MNIPVFTKPLKEKLNISKQPLLVVLIVLQSSFLTSQIFNNAYLTFGYGYRNHMDLNLNCHFLKYFSASVYKGETNHDVGPVYYTSEALFSRGQRLTDNYSYSGCLLGITTRTKKFYDISGMMGYSELKTYENINIVKKENSNGTDYILYDIMKRKANSLTFRVDFLLRINQAMGFNFSFIKNYNSISSEFNFTVGLSIGIVEDFRSEKWKWNQKKKV